MLAKKDVSGNNLQNIFVAAEFSGADARTAGNHAN
jgi:hypothetical protein